MAVIRTAWTLLVAAIATVVGASIVLIAALLRIPHREGGVYAVVPRIWSRVILAAAGVKVRVHGTENLVSGPAIFTCNHVSLFDIPVLSTSLPHHYFVAKAELFKVPVFGPGIRATGTIPIERENQKAAFGAFDEAAARVRGGSSVIVFPEGTRGHSYELRRFKKGPFVLAIKAGVPIVPCLLHGTLEVLPKKSRWIRPAQVDVHILQPVPTSGLDYSEREQLARDVHERMANAMRDLYPNSDSSWQPSLQ